MEISKIKLTQIEPADYNPRTITEEAKKKLRNSIETFGLVEPIIINTKNNRIVSGHQRYDILLDMLMESDNLAEREFDYLVKDDYGYIFDFNQLQIKNEDYEKALNIVLNNTNLMGDYDYQKLGSLLEELEFNGFNLEFTGFDDFEVDSLNFGNDFDYDFEGIYEPPISTVEDDYDFPAEDELEVTVEVGDLYELGNHRLLCGDATKEEDVNRLMNNNKADIVFTSPPYNVGNVVGYEGKSSRYKNDDDNRNDYAELLNKFTKNALNNSEYVFVNLQLLANNKLDLITYIYDNKKSLADILIWDKGNGTPNIAKNVTTSCFEFILVFSKKGNRAIGTKEFQGTVKNIIRVPSQHNNEFSKIHNVTFPINLPSNVIQDFSKYSILDLFGGTGTTLIACEQLNRKCYMMEIDPYYCQVILNRWEEFTGEKAEKVEQ